MQIEHISNINYKSFNNYTSNSNLKYVNIFFWHKWKWEIFTSRMVISKKY